MSTSPTFFETTTTTARFPQVSPIARVAIGGMAVIALTYVYIIFTFDVPRGLLALPAVMTAAGALIATGKRWAAIPAALLLVVNVVIETPLIVNWHLHDVETTNAVISNVVLLPAAGLVTAAAVIAYTVQSYRGCSLELGRLGRAGIVVVVGAVLGGSLIALLPHYGATSRVSIAAVESLEPSVVMGESLFRDEEMRVAVGETVQWRVLNADAIGHTFDIDALGIHMTLGGGESGLVMFVADRAGSFEFNCRVPGHEDMKGTLVVQ